MSDQEYFVYVDVGVMFTLSFYPKIPTHDLFSNTSTLGRSDFLVLPGLHGVFALQWHHYLLEIHHCGRSSDFWWQRHLLKGVTAGRRFQPLSSREFRSGRKVVVNENIFEWKGKDQSFGNDGYLHVTKIIRKTKGVGMEAKSLTCCTTRIMVTMEIMGPKEQMQPRE